MNNCGLSLRALRFLRYNAMIVPVCGSQMMKFRFTDKKEKLCSSKGEIYDGKDRSDHWFSGSGKTTFIRKYAQYLMDAGNNIGILENDYGAVNVDMMLLQDLMGENCELEMISGGCDKDCHRRRFKTKLIAMGMCGYDRVIVEPSGDF